jgi:hypothetical protein
MAADDSNTPGFEAKTSVTAAPDAPTTPPAHTRSGIVETTASAVDTTIHEIQETVSTIDRALRFIVPIAGVSAIASGICWLVKPQLAADLLGMPLLKDQPMGLSTQIGDLASFFVSSGVMMLLGWITRQRAWLISAALLYGTAAVFRIIAWNMQGASLPAPIVIFEVILAAVLLLAAYRYKHK